MVGDSASCLMILPHSALCLMISPCVVAADNCDRFSLGNRKYRY